MDAGNRMNGGTWRHTGHRDVGHMYTKMHVGSFVIVTKPLS